MDISNEWASPGTMCAFVISWGSHGMFRLHSCVELIVSPFGQVMRTGCLVGLTFVTGASSITKWPVVPESLMANCLLTFMAVVTALWAAWGKALPVLCRVVMLLCDSVLASVPCVLTLDAHTVTSSSSTIPMSKVLATGD